MIFIPNCHWNHTKIEFGMIPEAIWYEYHTSVFAVHITIVIVYMVTLEYQNLKVDFHCHACN